MRMQKRPHTRPLTMLSDLGAGVVGLHTPMLGAMAGTMQVRRGDRCLGTPVALAGPRGRRQLAAASGSVADAGAVSGGAESVPA